MQPTSAACIRVMNGHHMCFAHASHDFYTTISPSPINTTQSLHYCTCGFLHPTSYETPLCNELWSRSHNNELACAHMVRIVPSLLTLRTISNTRAQSTLRWCARPDVSSPQRQSPSAVACIGAHTDTMCDSCGSH